MNGDVSTGALIAVVIGVIAIFFVFRWLIARGTDAVVNNTVSRRTVQAGNQMTSSDLVITTKADTASVIDAIRHQVQAEQAAPAIATTLYVTGSGDNAITYAYGNKLGTSFQARVTACATAAGTEVLVEVTNWTKSGATKAGSTVQHGPRMQRLRDEVAAAVRTLDPALRTEVVAR